MRWMRRRIGFFSASALSLLIFLGLKDDEAAAFAVTTEPPEIAIGYDAFLRGEQWPALRIGVRAYMRSTFDGTGGNHLEDAAYYIRQMYDYHRDGVVVGGP